MKRPLRLHEILTYFYKNPKKIDPEDKLSVDFNDF